MGLKRPQNVQTTTRHSGQIHPWSSAIIYAWMPKILSRCKKPKCTLGPRPNTTVRLFRGLTSRSINSALLKGSLPRPLVAEAISASLEAPSAEPSARPRRGGNSASLETPLGRSEQQPNRSMGRAHLLTNHPAAWSGVRRRQPASATMPHCGRDRRPVRLLRTLCHYSRCGAECCADLSDTASPLCRLPVDTVF